MISSPGKEGELREIIRQHGFRHTFVIDDGNRFADMNSLPSPRYLRTFLLDGGGRVVVIGNPLDTPALGKAYIKHLGMEEDVLEETPPAGTFDFGGIAHRDTVSSGKIK